MTHGVQHVGQQHADKGVVFHEKDTQGPHIISSRQVYVGHYPRSLI